MFLTTELLTVFIALWLSSTRDVVIDSDLSLTQSLVGSSAPQAILDSLAIISVEYHGMDGRRHRGQFVVHRMLVDDVREIFHSLDSAQFPIQSVIPIARFSWSDNASIAANNTSAFNYRTVAGTHRLSMHAFGRAIDLNPFLNPMVSATGKSPRPYNIHSSGTITRGDVVYRSFISRGWSWGGDWRGAKDYQHFEKR